MGYFSSLIRPLQNSQEIAVLMYHRVRDDLPPGPLIIGVKAFREQMKYLKRHCHVISIKHMCAYYADGLPIPGSRRPQVVITFDDGYRDTYTHAFPVLKEFGLEAAVFLATDFIGTDRKMATYSHLTGTDMLSWQEAGAMQATGHITFAAHTASHPHLPQLDYAQQKKEIASSIKAVEEHLSEKTALSIFCYPYGQYNQDSLDLMRELGIKIALTVRDGFNTGKENPHEIKRICADGTFTLAEFMRRLNPLPHWLQWRIDMLKDYQKKIFSGRRV